MEELRNKIIGEFIQIILVEKNFPELVVTVVKDKINDEVICKEFLFKTPYVGKHNWIKIKIKNDFIIKNSFLELSYKIDTELYIDSNMFVDSFFEKINKIEKQK